MIVCVYHTEQHTIHTIHTPYTHHTHTIHTHTLQVLSKIWDKAIESRLDRRCTFVALGGGVVGDMTGYAAASYLRGVNFVQVCRDCVMIKVIIACTYIPSGTLFLVTLLHILVHISTPSFLPIHPLLSSHPPTHSYPPTPTPPIHPRTPFHPPTHTHTHTHTHHRFPPQSWLR